jgi:hypothetical protein
MFDLLFARIFSILCWDVMIQFYWSLHNSGNQRHYNSFISDPECTKYFIIYLLLKDEVSPRESSQRRRLPLVEQIADKFMRWHVVTAEKREWERSVSSVFIALCLTFIVYLDYGIGWLRSHLIQKPNLRSVWIEERRRLVLHHHALAAVHS